MWYSRNSFVHSGKELCFLNIVSCASSFLDEVYAVVAPVDVRSVAHCLAKFSLSFINNFVWLKDCPLCVTNLVLNDRSGLLVPVLSTNFFIQKTKKQQSFPFIFL
ncbi:hypothetical protein ACOSP7_007031 [Xanthoceras sorbifolium]